jgi:uncharacterized tellurite resistance protein B-like protein
MTTQEETLIRHLIAMIQADGIIKPEETDLLARVLTRLELAPEDIAQAGTWLTVPQEVDLEALRSAFPEQQERQFVSGLLLELAQVDSMIGHQEVKLLGHLAQALGEP